jgi:hypothetical protein
MQPRRGVAGPGQVPVGADEYGCAGAGRLGNVEPLPPRARRRGELPAVRAVGRLNEFGRVLELSPAELAFTLLLDGTTTAREAAAAVHRAGLAEPSAVALLVRRLENAGFCVTAQSASSLG